MYGDDALPRALEGDTQYILKEFNRYSVISVNEAKQSISSSEIWFSGMLDFSLHRAPASLGKSANIDTIDSTLEISCSRFICTELQSLTLSVSILKIMLKYSAKGASNIFAVHTPDGNFSYIMTHLRDQLLLVS